MNHPNDLTQLIAPSKFQLDLITPPLLIAFIHSYKAYNDLLIPLPPHPLRN